MCKIVIHVEQGLVQQVYSSDGDANIVVVDFDAEGSHPGDPEIVQVHHPTGRGLAHVCRWIPEPLEGLTGSDVEAAIEGAEHLHPYSPREITTMLVALRAWQSLLRREGDAAVRAYPHFDEQPPLDEAQIDALCERLNEPLAV